MQRNQDKDFDKLFKDTFADAEITPSENLWNGIEETLVSETSFDTVFKNTFEDAEIEPSGNLWNAIETEIEPKKKRKLPIYWLSAAAVLIVATIGILINKEQTVEKPGVKLANKPKTEIPTIKDTLAMPVIKSIETELIAKQPELILKHKVRKKVEQNTAPINDVEEAKEESVITQVKPQNGDLNNTVIASNVVPKGNQTVPDNTINLDVVPQVTDEPINENDQSSRGIRNFGDIVNLVVNKVDKRKDKLIQFKTDEGDDSSISSINIGPFRIGKHRK